MLGTLIDHDARERQLARGLMNALQPALGVGRSNSGCIPFGATAGADQRQTGENATQGKPLPARCSGIPYRARCKALLHGVHRAAPSLTTSLA